MSKTQNDVPELVKELQQRLALNQEQFAQTVGVTYSTVNLRNASVEVRILGT